MKILVISNNYPSNSSPNSGVFVYNLIQQFVKQGNEVTVIATHSITSGIISRITSKGKIKLWIGIS